jgi:hypothetical protein
VTYTLVLRSLYDNRPCYLHVVATELAGVRGFQCSPIIPRVSSQDAWGAEVQGCAGPVGDKKKRELQFKIIDMGHARLLGHKTDHKLPQAPVMEKMYRRFVPPPLPIADGVAPVCIS